MTVERCRLLDEKGKKESLVEDRYERRKYDVRRTRTALITGLVLLLTVVYLIGRPYPRLVPYIWRSQMSPIPMKYTRQNKYLVRSPHCQILDIDPFQKESMKKFVKKSYISCATGPPYVYMVKNETQHILYVNKTTIRKPYQMSCCYKNITRSYACPKVMESNCSPINNYLAVTDNVEFIQTVCKVNSRTHKETHNDVFINIHPSKEVLNRFEHFNSIYQDQYWNVLIIGIDTLSRINLERAMPITHFFLKNNSWLDFQGYNKIDENTFPNLMAFLTGKNQTRARLVCDGEGENSLDNCEFIWKTFQKAGYVTAYAEDNIGIDTFEKPYHKGFIHKPTDHYLRPLFSVAEKSINKHSRSIHCTGQKTSGEVILQYALEFVNTYKNDPFFGFFWANTFSHDDIGSPSSMDERITEFLEKINTLENTFIFFISDHGIRFGKMRATIPGYYEERLPAFFISVPETFKQLHQTAYNDMISNTKKLTNPYDFYMTLQDILFMSGRKEAAIPGEACPKCQSLFQSVPWNRSCADCAITPHWCTCNPLRPLPLDLPEALRAIRYITDVIIEEVFTSVNTKMCRKCAKLNLHKVISVYTYDYLYDPMNTTDYLLVFSVNPGNMVYEATVNHDTINDKFTQLGIVSRLSAYEDTGGCVPTAYLKNYCFCDSQIINAFCQLL